MFRIVEYTVAGGVKPVPGYPAYETKELPLKLVRAWEARAPWSSRTTRPRFVSDGKKFIANPFPY